VRRAFAAGSVLAVASLLAATPAFAVHDEGSFEFDGNALGGGAPGIDWSTLFPSGGWSGAIAASFVDDGSLAPPDVSYFTGGGSKDPHDVTDWAWTSGDVAPDKDELTHAFAVAYRATRDTGKTNIGNLLIGFGADRYADNGDAQIGFWFFRSSIIRAAGGAFGGSHTVGDVLVLSDFTQGGRVGTVRVFKWVGAGGSDGSLDLLASATDCSSAPPDDVACAEGNTAATASPWSFIPKSGSAGVFPQGSFFEGAIDVTRLVPGVTCFKSFMAETRSSQSVGAQLKDMVLGPFDTCARAPLAPGTSSGTVTTATGQQLPATGANINTHALLAWDLMGIGVFLRRRARRASRATP